MRLSTMPLLLLVLSILLGFCSAAFSVIGFITIFGEKDYFILAAAVTVEASKLVLVSYVYNYWSVASIKARVAGASLLVLLLLFTAIGTYGYLVGGYVKSNSSKNELAVEIARYQNDLLAIRNEQEFQRSEVQTLKTAKSKTVYEAYSQLNKDKLTARTDALNSKIQALKNQLDKSQTHIGPMNQVSIVTGVSVDKLVFWFVVLFMTVLDPLAVFLTIAFNHTNNLRKQQESQSITADQSKVGNGPSASTKPIKTNTADFIDGVIGQTNKRVSTISSIDVAGLPVKQVLMGTN